MRAEDLAALEAAGLYDPTAAGAAERLALLEWLAAQGATVQQMIDTPRRGSTLTGLAGDLALGATSERLTLAEAAARVGTTPERLERLHLASGLPPVDPSARQLGPEDALAFAAFARGADLFGETAILQFVRVLGSSLARIAEAGVSLFLVNMEGPIREANAGDLALAQANLAAIRAMQGIPTAIQSMFRSHMEVAIRRLRTTRDERSVDLVRMAIGFIDLVGFTSISRQLSARALADLIAEFEARAHDIVAERDGRLVKLIGDEVMYVTRDASTACDVALTLVEQFSDDPAVMPRGGLAFGPLVMRSGDYYGPIVNLASRIADLAVPNEVLVSAEVASHAAPERFRFEPSGKRMLKGFDEPVVLYAAQRAERAGGKP